MQARKRSGASILTLTVVLAALASTGCHSGHTTAGVGTGEACPVCQTEVRVMPLTGLTYTVCICPECKKVSSLDAATREAVELYVGGQVGDTVHVCDKCEAIIERCAVCREK